jgi:hypothetical protein
MQYHQNNKTNANSTLEILQYLLPKKQSTRPKTVEPNPILIQGLASSACSK